MKKYIEPALKSFNKTVADYKNVLNKLSTPAERGCFDDNLMKLHQLLNELINMQKAEEEIAKELKQQK